MSDSSVQQMRDSSGSRLGTSHQPPITVDEIVAAIRLKFSDDTETKIRGISEYEYYKHRATSDQITQAWEQWAVMNSPQSPTSPQNDPEGSPHPHSGASRNLAPSSAPERGFLQPASIQDFRIGDVFAVYHDDDVFAPSTYRVIAPLVCRKLDVSGYVVRLIADVVQASDGGVVTAFRPQTPYTPTTEEKAHAILVRNAHLHRDEYKLSEKDE